MTGSSRPERGEHKIETRYWQVDPKEPEQTIIAKAAALLKAEELVAFPTETVYGLGALAQSERAVAKIFTAKGRPPQNPLLVHISGMEQLDGLVKAIPAIARSLMDEFWPGPLSIILPAREDVPAIVRGGRNSVGLRMPAHPVALALINAAGPVAAPSANLSGRPSPLTAEHVRTDLDGKIAAVLDAGLAGIGLESTLLDLSAGKPQVLRLGGLPLEKLQEILEDELEVAANDSDERPHYQTAARIILCADDDDFVARQEHCLNHKKNFAVVTNNLEHEHIINESVNTYRLDLHNSVSNFYAILREAEQAGVELLLLPPLPPDLHRVNPALLDRIERAATINK